MINKRSANNLYSRFIIIIITAFILIGAVRFFYVFYTSSPSFNVKKIIVIGEKLPSRVDYDKLKKLVLGKNIFSIRLKSVSSFLLDNYRELRSLQIRMAFPDSIIIQPVARQPVAQIAQDRYYPIDEDFIVLIDAPQEPAKELLIISGIDKSASKFVGRKMESDSLRCALSLFKSIKASGLLNKYAVTEVYAGNIRDLSFFINGTLEVKIGYEEHEKRLKKLKEMLKDPKIDTTFIGYIDLRFGEPVIGPRWKR